MRSGNVLTTLSPSDSLINARDILRAKAKTKKVGSGTYIAKKEDRIAGRNRKEMRWIDENVGGEETGG